MHEYYTVCDLQLDICILYSSLKNYKSHISKTIAEHTEYEQGHYK